MLMAEDAAVARSIQAAVILGLLNRRVAMPLTLLFTATIPPLIAAATRVMEKAARRKNFQQLVAELRVVAVQLAEFRVVAAQLAEFRVVATLLAGEAIVAVVVVAEDTVEDLDDITLLSMPGLKM